MRILVTGGSGFVGRRFVPLAVRAGHSVVVMSRAAASDERLLAAGAGVVRGDLDDPASVDDAFQRADADAIVNIASLGFGHAPTIVAAAEDAGVARAVFVSTTAVTTQLNVQSKSVRLEAERTIKASDLVWTILRPTMIYGGTDDRNLARLLQLIKRTPVIPVPGGGGHLQQPVHVDDVATALLTVVETDTTMCRSYDLAGPEPISFRRLVEEAAAAVGRRVVVVPVPLAPVVAVVGAYERLARHPRLKAEQFQRLTEDKAFAITDAAGDFAYAPRTFAVGIRSEAQAL